MDEKIKNTITQSYAENGYCVIENIISDSDCEALIMEGERVQTVRGHDTRTPMMQPHRDSELMWQTMCRTEITDIMKLALGSDICGLQTQYFFAPPGTKGLFAHQDNYYVGSTQDGFASAWIALVDTHPANGGLWGRPGTHREPLLPVVDIENADDLSGQALKEETQVPEKYGTASISAPRGSVVLLHSHFVHWSGLNETQEKRHAFLCTYKQIGAPFRPGKNAKRREMKLNGSWERG